MTAPFKALEGSSGPDPHAPRPLRRACGERPTAGQDLPPLPISRERSRRRRFRPRAPAGRQPALDGCLTQRPAKTCPASSRWTTTVEGSNGVGKTSLMAIAGYNLRTEFAAGRSQRLFLTRAEPFQLLPGGNLDERRRRVYCSIARAFIEHHETLKATNLVAPDVANGRLVTQSASVARYSTTWLAWIVGAGSRRTKSRRRHLMRCCFRAVARVSTGAMTVWV